MTHLALHLFGYTAAGNSTIECHVPALPLSREAKPVTCSLGILWRCIEWSSVSPARTTWLSFYSSSYRVKRWQVDWIN